MATYSVRLLTPEGSPVPIPPLHTTLDYAKTVNNTGVLKLTYLEGEIDPRLFREDMRIQVWRQIENRAPYLDLDAVWFVTSRFVSAGPDRRRRINVSARSAIDLTSRRLVAYHSSSSQATITNLPADNAMKRVVSENLGSSAGGRSMGTYLSVRANASLGPLVSKQIGWRNVLQVIQEIARDSEVAGTPVYYDIIAGGSQGLEFCTWIGQPGLDRTGNIGLSLENGTLRSAEWGFDRTEGANIIYALGQEFNGTRQVQYGIDSSYYLTPFSRREVSVDARNATLSTELQSEANAELGRRKPKTFVTAEIANSEAAPYGIMWRYGDRLAVIIDGVRYSCLVETVQVSVTNGREQVKATLRF